MFISLQSLIVYTRRGVRCRHAHVHVKLTMSNVWPTGRNISNLRPPVRYDHQSVDEIVGFVLKEVEESDAGRRVPGGGGGKEGEIPGDFVIGEPEGLVKTASAAGGAEKQLPSSLLKVLRPPSAQRPLFLAAPGVANAQVGPLNSFVTPS